MKLLSDIEIRRIVSEKNVIEPFVGESVHKGVISYGLSSYGYDMRLSNKFCVPKRYHLLDPKTVKEHFLDYFVEWEGDSYTLSPRQMVLGMSVEKFSIPTNVTGLCLGKSTYARCGISVNITPLEAGWVGHVVIEISNVNHVPVKLYANEGIAQVLFFEADEKCEVDYSSKGGKYQNQQEFLIRV